MIKENLFLVIESIRRSINDTATELELLKCYKKDETMKQQLLTNVNYINDLLDNLYCIVESINLSDFLDCTIGLEEKKAIEKIGSGMFSMELEKIEKLYRIRELLKEIK